MVEIREAIHAINSSAEFSYQNEDINTIQWNENTTPISTTDIESKLAELKADYDNNEYQRKRDAEYPSIKDQPDKIYH